MRVTRIMLAVTVSAGCAHHPVDCALGMMEWDDCESYAERNNLTLRMGSRRFTRLTNAFSKKVENHAHSVAIHTMHYNFVRIRVAARHYRRPCSQSSRNRARIR